MNASVNASRAQVTESDIVSSSLAGYLQGVYNFGAGVRFTGGVRLTHDYRRINSHNRIDRSIALQPLPAGGTSFCALLSPALGGPVYPNCAYAASAKWNRKTWLASVDWRPSESIMLYGTVSTGYRAGAFTVPGTAVIGSVAALDATFTPYKPETLMNYEVGLKSDLFDRHLRFNLSAYYMKYSNIQVRVRDVVNGVLIQSVRNAAKATIYGGEAEATLAPVRGLTLYASAGYVHARYDSYIARDTAGNLLDLSAQPFPIPEWTAAAAVSYEMTLPDGSLKFNANYAYRDPVIFVPGLTGVAAAGVTQRAYGLVDARISWSIASQQLEVSVFAKNLLDKHYLTSSASVGPFTIGSVGDPQTFGLQVRKTF